MLLKAFQNYFKRITKNTIISKRFKLFEYQPTLLMTHIRYY